MQLVPPINHDDQGDLRCDAACRIDCTDLQCGCPCHEISTPGFDNIGGAPVVTVKLSARTHRIADAVQQVDAYMKWPYLNTPAPGTWARLAAKRAIWQMGVFAAGGPDAVVIAPAVPGGIVLAFSHKKRDVCIAVLNTQRIIMAGSSQVFGAARRWEFAGAQLDAVLGNLYRLLLAE